MPHLSASLGRSFRGTVGGLPRTFWWLWTGTLVNRSGGFVLPFLAFYVTQELHRSAGVAGAVLAAGGLGSVAAAIGGGVLTDRIGRRPVLLVSQLLSAATLVGLGFSRSTLPLIVWSAAYGLMSNASRPAYSAMMADIVEPSERTRAYSLNYWAINLGFSIAPVLGGLLAHWGYLTLFLGDAATTAVFALLVYLRVPESHPGLSSDGGALTTQGTLLDVARDGVFMAYVLLWLGVALIFMQHLSTLPVAMGNDGLRPATYGGVLAINGILIVLVTVPVTRVLAGYPSAKVLAVSTAFVGLGFAATFLAHTAPAYAATVVIWTVGEVIGAGVGPAVVADLAPASMRGRYQGVFSLSFSAAAFLAPLVGGGAFDLFGGTTLWLGCGVLGLAVAAGHLAIGPTRDRRVAELQAGEALPSRQADGAAQA